LLCLRSHSREREGATSIGNALKFTPAEATITLSAHSLGAEVQFAVCDRGPGIPEAALFAQHGACRRRHPPL